MVFVGADHYAVDGFVSAVLDYVWDILWRYEAIPLVPQVKRDNIARQVLIEYAMRNWSTVRFLEYRAPILLGHALHGVPVDEPPILNRPYKLTLSHCAPNYCFAPSRRSE
jgi:hypothetical protein